jgi:hypothetical protein
MVCQCDDEDTWEDKVIINNFRYKVYTTFQQSDFQRFARKLGDDVIPIRIALAKREYFTNGSRIHLITSHTERTMPVQRTLSTPPKNVSTMKPKQLRGNRQTHTETNVFAPANTVTRRQNSSITRKTLGTCVE